MAIQLLRTILIILIAYYLFKLLSRYVLPWLARYFIRKSMSGFENRQNTGPRRNGEMNADHRADRKGALDDIGEYVDYEEIEDNKTDKL